VQLLDVFVDVTEAWGLDFQHQAHSDEPYFMPRMVGSGAAVLDYDSDGYLDLYLLQNGGTNSGIPNRLYRGSATGKFEDVTMGSGLDVDGRGMGVAVGDVNNDGKVDVLVTEYGRARLFLNESTGAKPAFRDISESAGIRDYYWGLSTSFLDYDRDGWLDIVLVNYVDYDPARWCADGKSRQDFCGPRAFGGRPTQLFHNMGGAANATNDSVRFEDVTVTSKIGSRPGPGLGVFCADFDGDAWPDILVANDGKPNHLWINQKDGTFEEEAELRGIGYNNMGESEADMGIAIGDVNGDGTFDIFVTHLTTETHTLWVQQPRGMFMDQTAKSGLANSAWRGTGFGTAMVDLDNTGAADMVVVNGRVVRAGVDSEHMAEGLAEFWQPYAERNQLFKNVNGKFVDISEQNPAFCGRAEVSRGLVCADFDSDGGIDLLVTQVAGPARLYRNSLKQRGHWLLVRALDAKHQRDAYGAEITIKTGDRTHIRWMNPGYSYACSNDPRVHVGLGDAANYDAIQVLWPDGQMETFPGGAADRLVELRQGEGKTP
jgi:hypothetical protein